jgi:hypothetical protein
VLFVNTVKMIHISVFPVPLTWCYKINEIFELSSFTNTSYCETAHRLTPGFLGVYIIILYLIRAEYYYLLILSHPTFLFRFNFVQIFS